MCRLGSASVGIRQRPVLRQRGAGASPGNGFVCTVLCSQYLPRQLKHGPDSNLIGVKGS
jgi:hypothetical protein